MSDHITIYERVYFDAKGEPVRWERSSDRQNWEPVQHFYDKPPFVLIKPVPLPAVIESEIWEIEGYRRTMRCESAAPDSQPAKESKP